MFAQQRCSKVTVRGRGGGGGAWRAGIQTALTTSCTCAPTTIVYQVWSVTNGKAKAEESQNGEATCVALPLPCPNGKATCVPALTTFCTCARPTLVCQVPQVVSLTPLPIVCQQMCAPLRPPSSDVCAPPPTPHRTGQTLAPPPPHIVWQVW